MTRDPDNKSLAAVLRALWRDVGGNLRKLIQGLLILGVIDVVLGIAGEREGWWSEHPFLTNLAASFASACFGIPFAVLVIQYFLRAQEAKSVTLRLLDSVHDRWAALAGGNRSTRDLDRAADHLSQAHQRVESAGAQRPEEFARYSDSVKSGYDSAVIMAELRTLVRELYDTWRPPADTLEILSSVDERWQATQRSLVRFAEVGLSRPNDSRLKACDEHLLTLRNSYIHGMPLLAHALVGLARYGVIPRVYEGRLTSQETDSRMSEVDCILTFFRTYRNLMTEIRLLEKALERVRREVVEL